MTDLKCGHEISKIDKRKIDTKSQNKSNLSALYRLKYDQIHTVILCVYYQFMHKSLQERRADVTVSLTFITCIYKNILGIYTFPFYSIENMDYIKQYTYCTFDKLKKSSPYCSQKVVVFLEVNCML